MDHKSQFTLEQDRLILNAVCAHIFDKKKRTDKFADAVTFLTDYEITQPQFHEWIVTFNADNLRRK